MLHHPIRLPALLFLSALALPTAAGNVAFFSGPPGGVGDVLLVDESGLTPGQSVAGLSGVQLLPLDVSGRSPVTALLPDRAQLRLDVAGAARLLLPAGQGSLYRFRRGAAGGGATFGFFRIDGQGAASILIEHAGTGLLADADPFLERVAVDAAGSAMLCGTTAAAGGDLYECDLALGTAVERTTALAPLSLVTDGGSLFPTWGTAVAQQGIVRFARTPGAQAELVPVASIAAPGFYDGGIAGSADGSMAATVAGAGAALAHVLVYGPSGAAHPLDPTPQPLSGAGYQPDSPAGPYLALSSDGAFAGWRSEVPPTATKPASREAWVARTQPVAGDTPLQVTADAHFVDTLDETGLISFFSPTTMLFGVGEQADLGSQDIDGMDLYTAVLQPGGATVLTNATLTSGDTTQPFDKGELSTEHGVFELPGGGALALNRDKDILGLLQPGTVGLQTLVPETKSLDSVERAGDRLLVYIRSQVGSVDQKLYAVQPSAPASKVLLASLPTDATIERHALRADGQAGVVVRYFGKEWVARIDLVAGTAKLALSAPLAYGSALAFAPMGALALTAGAPGNPAFPILWSELGSVQLLPLPIAPGQILPGAS